MELKLTIHITPRTARRVAALVMAVGVAVAATVVHAVPVPIAGSFAENGVLTAKALNDNFSAVDSRLGALESSRVPPGTIVAFGGVTPPAGWLLCDGTTKPVADYPALAGALGSAFGPINSTVFTLPNLNGRTPIGAGKGTAADAQERQLGTSLGEETHVLTEPEMPSHTHKDAGHLHVAVNNAGSGAEPTPSIGGMIITTGTAFGSTRKGYADIQSAGSNQPHNNMQPSLVVNYIIKF